MSRSRVTTSASIRSRFARPIQAQLAKKATAKKTAKKAVKTSATASAPKSPGKQPAARQVAPKAAPDKPVARAKEREMKTYEKALAAMHKADWTGALGLFEKALGEYQDDAGILDRVRSFMRLCERNVGLKPFKPKTLDEYYESGVLHQNEGDLDGALKQFEKAGALDAKNDKVSYALAAVHALRDERPKALAHLRHAIELNGENRIFASNDSDLSLLRDEVEFGELTRSRG